MSFRPLHDRVLIKRVTAEQKSAGGLYIPESAKEKPQEGIVVAAGPGRRVGGGEPRPLTVKAEDRVIFGKYSGDEIKLNGEQHIVLRESDILAILD